MKNPCLYFFFEPHYAYFMQVRTGVYRILSEFPNLKVCPHPFASLVMLSMHASNHDGEICVIAALSSPAVEARLRSLTPYVVNISNSKPSVLQSPLITNDDSAVGKLAAHYVLDQGFRKFVYLSNTSATYSQLRHFSYKEEIKKRMGKSCQVKNISKSYRNNSHETIQKLPEGTAIFCANDICAHEVLLIASALQRPVPLSVAVLGVDADYFIRDLMDVSLTSIQLNSQEIGKQALRNLVKVMQGQTVPAHTYLPPVRVLEGGSMGGIAHSDPFMEKALRLLKEQAFGPYTIKDLMYDLQVSRRTLELHFQREMGTTPRKYLQRLRVERCIQLLYEQTHSGESLAAACGFRDARTLGRAFHKEIGMQVTEYHRKHVLQKKEAVHKIDKNQ